MKCPIKCINNCGRDAQERSSYCEICLGVVIESPEDQIKKKKTLKNKGRRISCCECFKCLGVIRDATLEKQTVYACHECRENWETLKMYADLLRPQNNETFSDFLKGDIFDRFKE